MQDSRYRSDCRCLIRSGAVSELRNESACSDRPDRATAGCQRTEGRRSNGNSAKRKLQSDGQFLSEFAIGPNFRGLPSENTPQSVCRNPNRRWLMHLRQFSARANWRRWGHLSRLRTYGVAHATVCYVLCSLDGRRHHASLLRRIRASRGRLQCEYARTSSFSATGQHRKCLKLVACHAPRLVERRKQCDSYHSLVLS